MSKAKRPRPKKPENPFIQQMQELNPEALTADGFDDAIIGIVHRASAEPYFAYSYEKCVAILQERDGMSREDAIEFFEFNTIGSYVGEFTPAFVQTEVFV